MTAISTLKRFCCLGRLLHSRQIGRVWMAILAKNSTSFPWMLQAVWPCLVRLVQWEGAPPISCLCLHLDTSGARLSLLLQIRYKYMQFTCINGTVGEGVPTLPKRFEDYAKFQLRKLTYGQKQVLQTSLKQCTPSNTVQLSGPFWSPRGWLHACLVVTVSPYPVASSHTSTVWLHSVI